MVVTVTILTILLIIKIRRMKREKKLAAQRKVIAKSYWELLSSYVTDSYFNQDAIKEAEDETARSIKSVESQV